MQMSHLRADEAWSFQAQSGRFEMRSITKQSIADETKRRVCGADTLYTLTSFRPNLMPDTHTHTNTHTRSTWTVGLPAVDCLDRHTHAHTRTHLHTEPDSRRKGVPTLGAGASASRRLRRQFAIFRRPRHCFTGRAKSQSRALCK